MLKNLLILSSFIALTACQNVPVKTAETKKSQLPTPKTIVDSDQDGVPDNIDECPNTPLNVLVDKKGCPMPISNEGYPSLPELRIFYGENNSYPKEQYFAEIKRIVEKMQEYPESFIKIEGHASKVEKNPDNVSRERAFIIAQILKEKYGISENRMSINFYGNQRPIAPNDTKERRAMNQRIYATLYPTKPILNP